jgi:hypothetical protein
MRNFVLKMARNLSLWAQSCTSKWVVDPEVYWMMDCGKLDMAAQELAMQEILWPDDPELIYAKTLLRFLRDNDENSA